MLNHTEHTTSLEALARLFKLLSVESRLRLIRLLTARAMCVGALARALGMTDAAVSQHLRALRDAELVTARRQGYYVHYALNRDKLNQLWEGADALLAAKDSEPCHTCCGEDDSHDPTREKEVNHA